MTALYNTILLYIDVSLIRHGSLHKHRVALFTQHFCGWGDIYETKQQQGS